MILLHVEMIRKVILEICYQSIPLKYNCITRLYLSLGLFLSTAIEEQQLKKTLAIINIPGVAGAVL